MNRITRLAAISASMRKKRHARRRRFFPNPPTTSETELSLAEGTHALTILYWITTLKQKRPELGFRSIAAHRASCDPLSSVAYSQKLIIRKNEKNPHRKFEIQIAVGAKPRLSNDTRVVPINYLIMPVFAGLWLNAVLEAFVFSAGRIVTTRLTVRSP